MFINFGAVEQHSRILNLWGDAIQKVFDTSSFEKIPLLPFNNSL